MANFFEKIFTKPKKEPKKEEIEEAAVSSFKPSSEQLSKPEETFDKARLEKTLKMIRSIWLEYLDSEEIEKFASDIAQNSDILNKALHNKDEFFKTLDTLNRLAEIEGAGKAQNLALSIIEANLPLIETYIKHDNTLFNVVCSGAADTLVNYGSLQQKDLGLQMLIKHMNTLVQDELPLGIASCLETIVRFGDHEISSKALDIFEERMSNIKTNKLESFILLAWCSMADRDLRVESLVNPILEKELKPYNIDVQKYMDAWQCSVSECLQRGIIFQKNISAIKTLESQRQGIVEFLNKNFGIFDLGRYPAEILIRQYDERDNDEMPYGVIFYPRGDHNGAFYGDYDAFQDLFKQLKNKYEIRVGEGASKIDIVKLLYRLDKKYGQKHKISFAIIGGHGTENSIHFGGNAEKNLLSTSDLRDERHPASKERQYFEQSPTFILVSCSTGAEHGIAEELANVMHATVIAPDQPTNLKSINIDIENNRLNFSVEYKTSGVEKTYVSEDIQ